VKIPSIPLTRCYTILNLFVLSIAIYGAVDVFYTLAGSRLVEVRTERNAAVRSEKPQAVDKRNPFSHYTPAINRNLFGAAQEAVADKDQLKIQELAPTTLKVALLGTVSGDTQTASAIIEDKIKKKQDLYKEGDAIQDATIVKILRGKVVLRVQDQNEILTMEEQQIPSGAKTLLSPRSSPSPSSATGTKITLESAVVKKSLENLTDLLSQVRVRPHYQDGKADGLLLSQVRPNTIFTKLGLQNGDIIQSVDGREIANPDDIMGFYEELKAGSPVSLDIMRRGRKSTLTYEFK
jgi:general secretion pathway protein C